MKKYFFNLWMLSLLLVACHNPTTENRNIDTLTDSRTIDTTLAITPDTLSKNDKIIISPESKSNNQISTLPDISGTHSLTLQWISWDRPGKINFTKTAEPDTYKINGEQKDAKLGSVQIDGIAKLINPLELSFDGTIKFNDGHSECTKEGKQTFLSTKNRKYWRLQSMLNCFNGETIDYVDIYF